MGKVLLAESNKAIQGMVRVTLQKADHEVYVVKNGNAAVEMAKELVPDVAMVDVTLPGLDGYEVSRALREIKALSMKPIMMIVGKGQPFDEVMANQVGIDDTLYFPFKAKELVDKTRSLMEKAGVKETEEDEVTETSEEGEPSDQSEEPAQPEGIEPSEAGKLNSLESLREDLQIEGLLGEEEGEWEKRLRTFDESAGGETEIRREGEGEGAGMDKTVSGRNGEWGKGREVEGEETIVETQKIEEVGQIELGGVGEGGEIGIVETAKGRKGEGEKLQEGELEGGEVEIDSKIDIVVKEILNKLEEPIKQAVREALEK